MTRLPLSVKLDNRASDLCFYGIAPPKLSTEPERLRAIAEQQRARFAALPLDALVVYDIQNEPGRSAGPRPFPFLPTVEPERYAFAELGAVDVPKIVYRCVHADSESSFTAWLDQAKLSGVPEFTVLVGAPSSPSGPVSQRSAGAFRLNEAYERARREHPGLEIGGVAIAERHAQKGNEHERLLDKMARGCRFFVSQAVYDSSSAMSLLSDYALLLRERGVAPVPIVLTFSPCGSPKTLEFMKWLGISFPRWLENELNHSADILERSVALCERLFAEIGAFAREKQLPIGINVESVTTRKVEVEASIELFHRLRARLLAL